MSDSLDIAQPSLGTDRADRQPANAALSLHFTSYKQDHGKKSFSPGMDHHYGIGCTANLRPANYYSASLDQLNNSILGVSHLDSLQTQTQHYFQQLALPSPKVQSRESSYLQLQTQARPREVSHQTVYRCSYVPYQPRASVCHKHPIVGAKEESGFTEGSSLQHYTFLPRHVHMGSQERVRQILSSVTRTDFLPAAFLQGSEMLPKLVSHTPRETAFTRDTRNPLASPASLLVRSPGHRQKSCLSAERSIGMKEGSGFILNTPTFKTLAHTSSDPLHFLTHYQNKFCDPATFAALKADWKRGGIYTQRDSGYSGRDTDRFNLCG